ncbi:hypothetical protein LXL04_034861 [Taraxacum kok-saghyz]
MAYETFKIMLVVDNSSLKDLVKSLHVAMLPRHFGLSSYQIGFIGIAAVHCTWSLLRIVSN